MKYCVAGRQSYSVLKKADEVKVQYRDIDRILDFIEKIPDKTVILEIPKDSQLDYSKIQLYNEKLNFVLAIENLSLIGELKNNNIKWYWSYPITTYYELNSILDHMPEYVLLGPPLCFDLEKISRKTNVEIRLIANTADVGYLPRENGIYGPWIRPEDVKEYGKYVSTLEFLEPDLTKEATLLHIYKDNEMWPGNLNLLLTGFGINVDNRALPDDIGEIRTKCGQRCMSRGTCNYCHTAILFAEALRKKHEELNNKKKD